MAAAERGLPDLDARIAAGEFAGLLGWLRHHVHAVGRLLESEPLVEQATGEKVSERFFLDSLRRRYAPAHRL
jgi:carboxypeptidase Taq